MGGGVLGRDLSRFGARIAKMDCGREELVGLLRCCGNTIMGGTEG
jgi:hypothetical protein